MIEKLEYWSGGIDVGGGLMQWRHHPDLDDVVDKVNESIDTINELDKKINELIGTIKELERKINESKTEERKY